MAKIKKKIRKLNIGVEVLQEFYLKEEKIDQINYENEIEYLNPNISEGGGGDLPIPPIVDGTIRISNPTMDEVEEFYDPEMDMSFSMNKRYQQILVVELTSGVYPNAVMENSTVGLTIGQVERELYYIKREPSYSYGEGGTIYIAKPVDNELGADMPKELLALPRNFNTESLVEQYEWMIPLGNIPMLDNSIYWRGDIVFNTDERYIVNNTSDFTPEEWNDVFVYTPTNNTSGETTSVNVNTYNGLPIVMRDGSVLSNGAPGSAYSGTSTRLQDSSYVIPYMIESIYLKHPEYYKLNGVIPTSEALAEAFNTYEPPYYTTSVKMDVDYIVNDSMTSTKYTNFDQELQVTMRLSLKQGTKYLMPLDFSFSHKNVSSSDSETFEYILSGTSYSDPDALNTDLPAFTSDGPCDILFKTTETKSSCLLGDTAYDQDGAVIGKYLGTPAYIRMERLSTAWRTGTPEGTISAATLALRYVMAEGYCVYTDVVRYDESAVDTETYIYSPPLLTVYAKGIDKLYEQYEPAL